MIRPRPALYFLDAVHRLSSGVRAFYFFPEVAAVHLAAIRDSLATDAVFTPAVREGAASSLALDQSGSVILLVADERNDDAPSAYDVVAP